MSVVSNYYYSIFLVPSCVIASIVSYREGSKLEAQPELSQFFLDREPPTNFNKRLRRNGCTALDPFHSGTFSAKKEVAKNVHNFSFFKNINFFPQKSLDFMFPYLK